MKRRIMFILGTRPEVIKMAPVINELKARPGKFEPVLCITAQHREMLDQVLEIFRLKPDHDLDIMRPDQGLFDITCNVLSGLKRPLEETSPDMVMVHGDTTTTMAGAIAAFYNKIPVGHVEAGLRTFRKYAPFPEELNRKTVTAYADINFAPTEGARQNLLDEGVPGNKIFVTGNTVIDALLSTTAIIASDAALRAEAEKKLSFLDSSKRLILVTGHRRESFGKGFEDICSTIRKLSLRDDVEIAYPVHLNPSVQEPVNRILSGHDNIHLLPPMEYLPFVSLMQRAHMIITDSGGIQEEAPSLGKPVLVTREHTERPEAVEAGTVRLVGTDAELLFSEATRLLDDPDAYQAMTGPDNPYGDGQASSRIADILERMDLRQ